jgi:hypothetical protein
MNILSNAGKRPFHFPAAKAQKPLLTRKEYLESASTKATLTGTVTQAKHHEAEESTSQITPYTQVPSAVDNVSDLYKIFNESIRQNTRQLATQRDMDTAQPPTIGKESNLSVQAANSIEKPQSSQRLFRRSPTEKVLVTVSRTHPLARKVFKEKDSLQGRRYHGIAAAHAFLMEDPEGNQVVGVAETGSPLAHHQQAPRSTTVDAVPTMAMLDQLQIKLMAHSEAAARHKAMMTTARMPHQGVKELSKPNYGIVIDHEHAIEKAKPLPEQKTTKAPHHQHTASSVQSTTTTLFGGWFAQNGRDLPIVPDHGPINQLLLPPVAARNSPRESGEETVGSELHDLRTSDLLRILEKENSEHLADLQRVLKEGAELILKAESRMERKIRRKKHAILETGIVCCQYSRFSPVMLSLKKDPKSSNKL